MRVHGRDHVYETLPPFLNNRRLPLAEQVVIGLRVATTPEQDAYNRQREQAFATYAIDKAQEVIDQKLHEMVKTKVAYVRGLVIEGINDDGGDLPFDAFYAQGPPELVAWVCRAVMSVTELSTAERKNFLPGSATPCASASTPAPDSNAAGAQNGSAAPATATTETG